MIYFKIPSKREPFFLHSSSSITENRLMYVVVNYRSESSFYNTRISKSDNILL